MAKIGIDLGTTNSLAACWTENGPFILPNALGDKLTPSVVSMDDNGEVLVGGVAKERLITHPAKTAATFKRMMGTDRRFRIGRESFRPEELSSFVLRSLKADAEAYLGEPVTEAIISVPAYFNDTQRKMTKTAAELAGLKVERLINEPTAAAVAYGFDKTGDDAVILVLDLGGGTFDVSILELFEGVMQVRAIAGDNFLGGEDFTHLLMDYFATTNSLDIKMMDLQQRSQLYKQAEQCKCRLSTEQSAQMQLNINGAPYTASIDSAGFEALCEPLFQRLRLPIERAVRDADLSVSEIDAVILVGGSTRMPSVRNMVTKMTGKMPYSNIDPDEAIALGASIQLALKDRDTALNEIILTDVCPYTLGVEISRQMSSGHHEGGYYLPVIERNTPIPASHVQTCNTVQNNQTQIILKVYQGESRRVENNILLGEIEFPVPKAPAGEVRVDVRFTYDVNGFLEVETFVFNSGLKKRLIIKNTVTDLTDEQINARFEELSNIKIHPREREENRLLLARGERLFQENIGEKREMIDSLIQDFEVVLETQDDQKIKAFAAVCKQKLDYFEGQDIFE